jgi:hypothetical protein
MHLLTLTNLAESVVGNLNMIKHYWVRSHLQVAKNYSHMEYTQVKLQLAFGISRPLFSVSSFTFCLANVGHGVVEDVPVTVSLDGNNVIAPINIIWNGIEKGSSVEVSFFVWLGHGSPFSLST